MKFIRKRLNESVNDYYFVRAEATLTDCVPNEDCRDFYVYDDSVWNYYDICDSIERGIALEREFLDKLNKESHFSDVNYNGLNPDAPEYNDDYTVEYTLKFSDGSNILSEKDFLRFVERYVENHPDVEEEIELEKEEKSRNRFSDQSHFYTGRYNYNDLQVEIINNFFVYDVTVTGKWHPQNNDNELFIYEIVSDIFDEFSIDVTHEVTSDDEAEWYNSRE